MLMINHSDIGTDEDLARLVLVVARDIAPCIASFPEGSEDEKNATAIVRGVYKALAPRGSQLVKSQRLGPAAVEYREVRSAFQGDPTRALQSLCPPATGRGNSRGSFPQERPISRLWPERY